jgi:putative ABC transport system substrate-binding protein
MKRRTLLAALAAAPALRAQPSRPRRLGWLGAGRDRDDPLFRPTIDTVVGALRTKGWVLGQNYLIEFRFVQGDAARYPALADELIAWRPDVLYSLETGAKVLVTKTRTIPIVLATSLDAVAAGLVHSLARPGTNVTGMSGQTDQLVAKQLELLVQLVPGLRRAALLADPQWAGVAQSAQYGRDAARHLGLDAFELGMAEDEAGVRAAFARFERERVGAVVVASSPGTARLGPLIAQQALRLRLPVAGLAAAGAVIEYRQDVIDQFRQSADSIAAIFRGADPAALPVRQASRFVLRVDRNAARALGLMLPQSLLLQADEVVE